MPEATTITQHDQLCCFVMYSYAGALHMDGRLAAAAAADKPAGFAAQLAGVLAALLKVSSVAHQRCGQLLWKQQGQQELQQQQQQQHRVRHVRIVMSCLQTCFKEIGTARYRLLW